MSLSEAYGDTVILPNKHAMCANSRKTNTIIFTCTLDFHANLGDISKHVLCIIPALQILSHLKS